MCKISIDAFNATQGRKFRDFRVVGTFHESFCQVINSKFAKVFARKITESSQLAKVFCIQCFSFLQVLALLFFNHPDLQSVGL